jgi:hypothetical protein
MMPLNSDKKAQYEAVKHDLEEERRQKQELIAALNADVRDLNASINTLSKRINPDASEPYPSTPIRPAMKYQNTSVRWAVLDLLHDSKPMATGEIASALKAGGIRTDAVNFANNVSAVLTSTMKENDEVVQVGDGKWELTDRGKEKIEHIRTTSRYRRALSNS